MEQSKSSVSPLQWVFIALWVLLAIVCVAAAYLKGLVAAWLTLGLFNIWWSRKEVRTDVGESGFETSCRVVLWAVLNITLSPLLFVWWQNRAWKLSGKGTE